MAGTSSVMEAQIRISDELHQGCYNQEFQHARFAPHDLAAKVLTIDILTALFEAAEIEDPKRCAQDAINGPDRKSRLKLLAILMLRPRLENLHSIKHWFKGQFPGFPSDEDLPLNSSQAQMLFPMGSSPGVARGFVDDQCIFISLVYKEGEPIRISKALERHHRHPIIGDPKRLGKGMSGIVQAINIAPGHFQFRGGTRNETTLCLAQKVFEPDFAEESFKNERDILENLTQSPARHDNILTSRGCVVVVDENRICKSFLLYDLATCDLREALRLSPIAINGGFRLFRDNLSERIEIIRQAKDLAWGLNSFHGIDLLHLDIKPENILIIKKEKNGQARYVWALNDYNLSKEKSLPAFSNETSSVSGPRGFGTFQGPEVREDGDRIRVGWWSDAWSLGCVLVLVLGYIYDGPEGLPKFLEERKAYRNGTADTFWRISTSGTFELNPAVGDYFQRIENLAERRSLEENKIVKGFLQFLKDRVLNPSPDDRRKEGRDFLFHEMKKLVKRFESLNAKSANELVNGEEKRSKAGAGQQSMEPATEDEIPPLNKYSSLSTFQVSDTAVHYDAAPSTNYNFSDCTVDASHQATPDRVKKFPQTVRTPMTNLHGAPATDRKQYTEPQSPLTRGLTNVSILDRSDQSFLTPTGLTANYAEEKETVSAPDLNHRSNSLGFTTLSSSSRPDMSATKSTTQFPFQNPGLTTSFSNSPAEYPAERQSQTSTVTPVVSPSQPILADLTSRSDPDPFGFTSAAKYPWNTSFSSDLPKSWVNPADLDQNPSGKSPAHYSQNISESPMVYTRSARRNPSSNVPPQNNEEQTRSLTIHTGFRPSSPSNPATTSANSSTDSQQVSEDHHSQHELSCAPAEVEMAHPKGSKNLSRSSSTQLTAANKSWSTSNIPQAQILHARTSSQPSDSKSILGTRMSRNSTTGSLTTPVNEVSAAFWGKSLTTPGQSSVDDSNVSPSSTTQPDYSHGAKPLPLTLPESPRRDPSRNSSIFSTAVSVRSNLSNGQNSGSIHSASTSGIACTKLCDLVHTFKGDFATSDAERILRDSQPFESSMPCTRCNMIPLHEAVKLNARSTHLPLIKLLLCDDYEADLACRDGSKRTLLEHAWDKKDYYVFKILLDNYDRRGVPIDIASLQKRSVSRDRDIQQLLKERGKAVERRWRK